MYMATVTSKGQITVPAEVRKAMRLKPGAKIMIFQDADGDFILRARTGSIKDLEGCLAGFALPRTEEEMNELIHRRAAEMDEATKSRAGRISEGEAA